MISLYTYHLHVREFFNSAEVRLWYTCTYKHPAKWHTEMESRGMQ